VAISSKNCRIAKCEGFAFHVSTQQQAISTKHREKYIYIYWKIKREEILIAIPQELAILIAIPQELAILIAILQELAMLACRSNC